MKYLFLFSFSLLTFFCTAQNETTKIEDAKIESFVAILMDIKKANVHHDSIIIATLAEVKMSKERYGEILKSNLDGEKLKLTKVEKTAIETINMKDEALKKQKAKLLEDKCKEKGLSMSDYNTIKEQMNRDETIRERVKFYITKSLSKR